jgi:hypothetical protein
MNNILTSKRNLQRLNWWLAIMVVVQIILTIPYPAIISMSHYNGLSVLQDLLTTPVVVGIARLIDFLGTLFIFVWLYREMGTESKLWKRLLGLIIATSILSKISLLVQSLAIQPGEMPDSADDVVIFINSLLVIFYYAVMIVFGFQLLKRCGGRLHRLGAIVLIVVVLPIFIDILAYLIIGSDPTLAPWSTFQVFHRILLLLLGILLLWGLRSVFVPNWQ